MREKFDNNNPTDLPLGAGYYGEWVGNTTATWMWNARNPLDVGVSVRELRDSGFSNQYQSVVTAPRLLDHYDGTATRAGGFAQQSWTAWSGRLHLAASARWDYHSIDRITAISQQASAAFLLTPAAQIQLAWGQYVQYPEISLLTSPLGGRGLLPVRSNHASVALERRLGERTRIRAEFYNRADRDLPFQPRRQTLRPAAEPALSRLAPRLRPRRGILPPALQRQPFHRLDFVCLRPHRNARWRRAGGLQQPVPFGLRPAPHRQSLRRLPLEAHRQSERALELWQRFPDPRLFAADRLALYSRA